MVGYLLRKAFYLPLFIVIFSAFMVSEWGLVFYRPRLLPEKAPPASPRMRIFRPPSYSSYTTLTTTNWFSPDGVMPSLLSGEETDTVTLALDPASAQPTTLSLNLLGTIVHVNPAKSVATFEFRGKTLVGKEDDELESLIKIYFIERGKVLFLNLEKNQYEFVELKKLESRQLLAFGPKNDIKESSIEKKGSFEFKIKRDLLTKATTNLTQLLKEAAMRPRRNKSGAIEGFCFSWIKGTSVFKDLGFSVGDCILSVNGEPVTNPQKALQTYNNLKKDAKDVRVDVLRDGQTRQFQYSIE